MLLYVYVYVYSCVFVCISLRHHITASSVAQWAEHCNGSERHWRCHRAIMTMTLTTVTDATNSMVLMIAGRGSVEMVDWVVGQLGGWAVGWMVVRWLADGVSLI